MIELICILERVFLVYLTVYNDYIICHCTFAYCIMCELGIGYEGRYGGPKVALKSGMST